MCVGGGEEEGGGKSLRVLKAKGEVNEGSVESSARTIYVATMSFDFEPERGEKTEYASS